MLRQQASLHAVDPEVYPEGWVGMAGLRDDVLRDVDGVGQRKRVWEGVRRKVEGNSNVRPMVREGRSGDVGRVWEWVGAVGLVESPGVATPGSALVHRGKSGRVSFGRATGEGDRGLEMRERGKLDGGVGKWEEGGSYY